MTVKANISAIAGADETRNEDEDTLINAETTTSFNPK